MKKAFLAGLLALASGAAFGQATLLNTFTAPQSGFFDATEIPAGASTLTLSVQGLGTSSYWVVVLQTSSDGQTWTECGTPIVLTPSGSATATCAPAGALYVRSSVTSYGVGVIGASLYNGVYAPVSTAANLASTLSATPQPLTVTNLLSEDMPVVNVMAYGAVSDALSVTDAAMTAGSATLTSASALFTPASVGKIISVQGVAGIAEPAAPSGTVSATGGSLAAGTYTVEVAAIDSSGNSSPVGPSTAFTTTGSTSSIALTWGAVTGAASYNIWLSTGQYFNTTTASFTLTTATGTAGNAPTQGMTLVTTIASYNSSSSVTLNASAMVSLSGTGAIWGTDNYAAFNSAMTAAAGKHLLIPYGNYLIDTQQGTATLNPASNTVISMDRSGVLYDVNANDNYQAGGAMFVVPDGTSNITMDGLHVKGEMQVGMPHRWVWSWIIEFANTGSHFKVTNGLFEDVYGEAIGGNGSTEDVSIVHNTFRNTGFSAINVNCDSSDLSDNYMNNVSGMEEAGAHIHIDRNTIVGAFGQSAIETGGGVADQEGSEISGNTVVNPASGTICISVSDGWQYTTVSGNVCTGLSGSNTNGIQATAGANPANYNSFVNNTVNGAGINAAFYMAEAVGTILTGNSDTGTPLHGLQVLGSSGQTTTSIGNTWYGTAQDIQVGSGISLVSRDTLLTGITYTFGGSTFDPSSVMYQPGGGGIVSHTFLGRTYVQGVTAFDGYALLNVLGAGQSGAGVGHSAFAAFDNNIVTTANNTLDDGSGNMTVAKTITPAAFATSTNCSSSASPAVCGSAAAGSFAIPAAATSVVVDDTAVTANSQIQLTFDSSLGTKLGVTCNATYAAPYVTARTAGTSFTVNVGTAPTTNPACFSFSVVN